MLKLKRLSIASKFTVLAATGCHSKIIVYFHDKYSGNRGKCPKCGIDFPLE